MRTDEQHEDPLETPLPFALPQGDQSGHVEAPLQYGIPDTVAVGVINVAEYRVGCILEKPDMALQDLVHNRVEDEGKAIGVAR